MKRKTSSTPTRVFKYRCYAPIANAHLVEQAFLDTRVHYNELIGIERDKRARYRLARARLFPTFDALDKQYNELREQIKEVRQQINDKKAETRSREVDPVLRAQLKTLGLALEPIKVTHKEMRTKIAKEPTLQAAAKLIKRLALKQIKTRRPGRYWGTYNLTEVAAKQACATSKFEPDFNDTPLHRLSSRIGVQFQGGLTSEELLTDTRLQILPMNRPEGRHPIGEKRRAKEKLLRLRIGSTPNGKPIFADFPMMMHRPLPADANLKMAYLTRRPYSVRIPWRYDVCLVLESKEFMGRQPSPEQQGTATINFGWRSLEGELRVAMINGESEIRLPSSILARFGKCRDLASIMDKQFDSTKALLSTWISQATCCPEGFLQAFADVEQWKSQHRLAELAWYWKSHRFEGDTDGYILVECWLERYRHLGDWLAHQRMHVLRWRDNFYQNWVVKLATTYRRLVVDSFDMAKIARRAKPEEKETGGDAARLNRMIAAPGELRACILRACAKYGCEVVMTAAKNTTRRCNLCGWVQYVGPRLVKTCVECGAVWDQDVNNTDNLEDRNEAGAVIPFVEPAKATEHGEVIPAQTRTFKSARKMLRKRVG